MFLELLTLLFMLVVALELSSEKTLIIAQGLERERILAATCYHSPTKLIILRNTNDIEALREPIENTLKLVKSDLATKSKDNIPLFPLLKKIYLEESCNFFDLAECIAKVDFLIETEAKRGAKVVVDVSSGLKIIGIGMYLAAILNRVPVTYFVAGKYASMSHIAHAAKKYADSAVESTLEPEQYAYSVKSCQVIPTFPLVLQDVPVGILKRLDSVGGYVETITRLLSSKDKAQIVKASRHLRSLEFLGYIGRIGKGYQITNEGKNFLKLEEVVRRHQAKLGFAEKSSGL